MSAQSNFAAYRQALKGATPPVIPYFGIYLTTLTFVDDGNSDTVTAYGLLSVAKRRRVLDTLDEIMRLQRERYYLVPLPAFQECLLHLQPLSEDERYALAVQRWEEYQANSSMAAAP